jgi:hypothetical protein
MAISYPDPDAIAEAALALYGPAKNKSAFVSADQLNVDPAMAMAGAAPADPAAGAPMPMPADPAAAAAPAMGGAPSPAADPTMGLPVDPSLLQQLSAPVAPPAEPPVGSLKDPGALAERILKTFGQLVQAIAPMLDPGRAKEITADIDAMNAATGQPPLDPAAGTPADPAASPGGPVPIYSPEVAAALTPPDAPAKMGSAAYQLQDTTPYSALISQIRAVLRN